jgi:hypothetical protein
LFLLGVDRSNRMPLSSQPSGSSSRATSVPLHHVILTIKDGGQAIDVQQCGGASCELDRPTQGGATRVMRALPPALGWLTDKRATTGIGNAATVHLRVPRTNASQRGRTTPRPAQGITPAWCSQAIAEKLANRDGLESWEFAKQGPAFIRSQRVAGAARVSPRPYGTGEHLFPITLNPLVIGSMMHDELMGLLSHANCARRASSLGPTARRRYRRSSLHLADRIQYLVSLVGRRAVIMGLREQRAAIPRAASAIPRRRRTPCGSWDLTLSHTRGFRRRRRD